MSTAEQTASGWKAKALREFRAYWLIVLHLTLVFAAFTQYRRLLLAAHGIEYTDYFVSLIKAMVLGKVIMLGDVLRLARGMDRRPPIYPTLYKTFVFTLFLVAFTVVENGVKGWWKDEGFVAGVSNFINKGWAELLASTLVIMITLIPFFALREVSRVVGASRLRELFFRQTGEAKEAAEGAGTREPRH